LLKALKELDFDHQMGKVSDKDFADISATYRGRAIRVMRQLDDAGRDYETMIAADVAKRIGAAESTAASAPSTAVAPTDKCAKCGTRNDSDAEFCKKCGGKLVREAS
ncbi:MAG TPA: zinc ribbon domain-containing protein, partial [Polyangia bacterium]